MEIKFKNVIYEEFNLNFLINSNEFTGVTGEGKSTILDLIKMKYLAKGEITFNDIIVDKSNLNSIRKSISLVESNFPKQAYLDSVKEYMEFIIKYYKLSIKDPDKKIQDSLKIVGLNQNILERNINTLSKSELKLVQIAISLLSNPEIILLDEPFLDLDTKNEKKIYMLLLKLKEQYKKTIVIASINSNMLYKYTTKMIFIKNSKVFLEGKTKEVYTRVDYLKRNKFEIPDIVMFTYKAKKNKQVKIDYHKDIRDIIKDIYKHV